MISKTNIFIGTVSLNSTNTDYLLDHFNYIFTSRESKYRSIVKKCDSLIK